MSRAVIITSYIDEPVDLGSLVSPEDHLVCLDGGYDFARAAGIEPDVLMGDFDSLESPVPEDSDIRILRFPPEKDYTDLELAFRLIDPAEHPELLVIGGLGGRLDQTLVNMQMLGRYTARPGENACGPDAGGTDAGGTNIGRPDACGTNAERPAAFGPNTGGPDACGTNAGGTSAAFGDGGRRFTRIEMVDGRNRCFVVHGNAGGPGKGCEGPAGPAAGCDGTPGPGAGCDGTAGPDAGCDGTARPDAGCDGTAPVTVAIPAEEGCCLSLIPLTEICGGVSLSGVKYPLVETTLNRGASLTVSNEFAGGQAVLRIGSGSVLVCLCRVR